MAIEKNLQPILSNSNNRPENIIIEMSGLFIPICDRIIYGIMGTELENDFSIIKNMPIAIPHEIFYQYAIYDKRTLLEKLIDEDKKHLLDDSDYMNNLNSIVQANYRYIVCNELMMRYSLISLTYASFVKKVVCVFDWEIADDDRIFIASIIPDTIRHKYVLTSGSLLEIIADNYEKDKKEFHYSSIFTNSISTVKELLDNKVKYNVANSFIFLLKSTDNLTLSNNEDGKIVASDLETDELIDRLFDKTKERPKTLMGVAKYNPTLANDAR